MYQRGNWKSRINRGYSWDNQLQMGSISNMLTPPVLHLASTWRWGSFQLLQQWVWRISIIRHWQRWDSRTWWSETWDAEIWVTLQLGKPEGHHEGFPKSYFIKTGSGKRRPPILARSTSNPSGFHWRKVELCTMPIDTVLSCLKHVGTVRFWAMLPLVVGS